MNKISKEFIIRQYRSGVESYANFTTDVGLWESEKYVFEKYLKTSDIIVDIGCGTGRITIALYQKGFTNIIGIDLTPEMIVEAERIQKSLGLDIEFNVGDAVKLMNADQSCNVVIFSFNGLMSIPSYTNRKRAVGEIHRILKEEGLFIFTTHDRSKESDYFDFWKEEQSRWSEGSQNTMLYEYGDIIASSKNESCDIFIHIPDQEEVEQMLLSCDFEIVESFYRSDQFEEDSRVKEKSGECRFWIARKS